MNIVVELPIANYRFGIFKHLLLVDIVLSIYPLLITPLVSLIVAIVLSIYPLLITPLVSFKHLLIVAIVLSNYHFGIFQTFINSAHCVVY